MNQEVSHPGNLSKDELQRSLQRAEVNLYKLVSISVRGGQTISAHDNSTVVPTRSLVLVEDPNENVTAPSGTDSNPICRGEAYIGSAKKKVAAFRKTAATPAAPSPTTPT